MAAAGSGRAARISAEVPRATSGVRPAAASSSRITSRSGGIPRSNPAPHGDTVIGEGSKVDNLVQIGHNVRVGRHCIIAAQCGLSGGVTLADHVTLNGHVTVSDDVRIGEGVLVEAHRSV